jgi:hypothetical protein
MNLQEMSNELLIARLVSEIFISKNSPAVRDCIYEISYRLCASKKHPYTIQYKWSACDVEIELSPAFTVWGTSPIDAAQTLVDANNWRGQDMEFLVSLKGSDNSTCFTSKELE